jgi:hypothetical protein
LKIRAVCPISGSHGSRKRYEIRLTYKLEIAHPCGIYNDFPMFSSIGLCLPNADINNNNNNNLIRHQHHLHIIQEQK